jgi:multisubunit Na+/H+ antiporter MnhG subunit
MSAVLVDALLWVLLAAGAAFAGIGVIGLLLFPDIRSRMFTSIRATLISCGAIFLAGIIYSLFSVFTQSGTQYTTFTVYAVLFLLLIIILNQIAAREIMQHITEMNRGATSNTIESGEKPDTTENQ